MNEMEQNDGLTDDVVPVMSEYERQRQAFLQEQARAGRFRLVGNILVALCLVLAGCAVAGYFALVRLPAEILRLEQAVSAERQARDNAGEMLDFYKAAKARSGLDAAGADPAKQLAALTQFTREPGFQELRKRGELSAVAELARCQARLAPLRNTLAQKQNRVKMLNREFNGPVGKGSASWQQKMAKAEAEQEAAEEALREATSVRDKQAQAAREALRGFEKKLPVPGGGASPEEEKLARLRAWRDRLMVWPLPALEKLFKSRES